MALPLNNASVFKKIPFPTRAITVTSVCCSFSQLHKIPLWSVEDIQPFRAPKIPPQRLQMMPKDIKLCNGKAKQLKFLSESFEVAWNSLYTSVSRSNQRLPDIFLSLNLGQLWLYQT